MVAIKKMFLIAFTINIVIFFIFGSVAILPGLNLVGVPFILVAWGGINMIMMIVCMFKCDTSGLPGG